MYPVLVLVLVTQASATALLGQQGVADQGGCLAPGTRFLNTIANVVLGNEGEVGGASTNSFKPATTNLEFFLYNPIFVTGMSYSKKYLYVDHMCLTYFAIPGDELTYLRYAVTSHTDGSHVISAAITSQAGTGVFVNSPCGDITVEYYLKYIGCDNFLTFRKSLYGDSTPDDFFTLSSTYSPISDYCLDEAKLIIPKLKFITFPLRQAAKCVRFPICLKWSNPFYPTIPCRGY